MSESRKQTIHGLIGIVVVAAIVALKFSVGGMIVRFLYDVFLSIAGLFR